MYTFNKSIESDSSSTSIDVTTFCCLRTEKCEKVWDRSSAAEKIAILHYAHWSGLRCHCLHIYEATKGSSIRVIIQKSRLLAHKKKDVGRSFLNQQMSSHRCCYTITVWFSLRPFSLNNTFLYAWTKKKNPLAKFIKHQFITRSLSHIFTYFSPEEYMAISVCGFWLLSDFLFTPFHNLLQPSVNNV